MSNAQYGKLPHDEQLEAAALGALLLWGRTKYSEPGRPDRVGPFFAACAPTDFYVPANAALAAAIKASAAQFDAVDNHLVWQKINDLGFVGAFAALDGPNYIVKLVNGAEGRPDALPGYASTISKLARRRELIRAAEDMLTAAADPELPKLADHVELANKTAELLKPRRRGRTAADVFDSSTDEPRLPMPLPWKRINAALGGGLPAANWSLLSAPPKRGKSCFVSACAAYWARHGKRVLIIATEASAEEVACRLLAQETGNGWAKLRRMTATKRREQAPRPEWFDHVTIVEHEPGELVSTIVAGHIADTGERPVVVVDHLHDIAGRLDERDERRSIDLTSSDIKRTAQREKLVILAVGIQAIATIAGEASRVGARANENTGKGSSRLAYDAAAVLAMSSEPFERGQEETRAEITVAFCREAATVEDNTVSLMMNGATGQFREVDAATTGPRLAPLDREILKVIKQREAELNVGAAVTREAIRSTLGKARESVNDAVNRMVSLGILAEKPGRAVAIVGEVR